MKYHYPARTLGFLALVIPHFAFGYSSVPGTYQAYQLDGVPAYWGYNSSDMTDSGACCVGSIYTSDGQNTFKDPTCSGSQTCQHTNDVGYQCVEYGIRYLWARFFKPKPFPNWPIYDAASMCEPGPPAGSGLVKEPPSYTPVEGDLMVYKRGPGYMQWGHVAAVARVHPDTNTVDLVEEHWETSPQCHRENIPMSYAYCWIHATANPGTGSCVGETAGVASGKAACPGPVAHGAIDGITAFNNIQASDHSTCVDGSHISLYSDAQGNSFAKMPQGGFQTEAGYGYQCLEYAYRYFFGHFHIKLPGGVPTAYSMCNIASNPTNPNGVTVHKPGDQYNPVHGDLMIFYPADMPEGARCGTGGSAGHVAVVDTVQGNNLTVVEQNWGLPGKAPAEPRSGNSQGVPLDKQCAACWIHANSNNNSASTINNNDGATCSVTFRQEAYALAIFNTGIAAALNTRGDLEVFARNMFGVISHAWQMKGIPALFPTGWSPWIPFIGVFGAYSDPVVIKNSDGRIEVFYLGAGGAIWHEWQVTAPATLHIPGTNIDIPIGATWSPPLPIFNLDIQPNPAQIVSISGNALAIKSNISAILINGRIHLYYLSAADNNIWTTEQLNRNDDMRWSAPRSLGFGKNAAANLTVVKAGNSIHLFYPGSLMSETPNITTDVFYVWHTYSTNGTSWAQPQMLDDIITSNVAAAVNPDGRLEIFYRGAAEGLRHLWQLTPGAAGIWNAPTPTGKDFFNTLLYDPSLGIPSVTSDPIAATNKDGTLQIFYRGQDGYVWTFNRISLGSVGNGTWSEARQTSGMITSSPITVIGDSTGRLHSLFLGPLMGSEVDLLRATAALLNNIPAPFNLAEDVPPINIYVDIIKALSNAVPFSNIAFDVSERNPNSYGAWNSPAYIFGVIPRDPTQQANQSGGGEASTIPGSSTGKLDDAGKAMIKKEEGYVDHCYQPGPTFGYGHDIGANGLSTCMVGGKMVNICSTGGTPQAQECADWLFDRDSQNFVNGVKSIFAGVALSQAQFDALVSLAYNAGVGGLQNSRIAAFLLQSPPDYTDAAEAIMHFAVTGYGFDLTSRRRGECEMFMTGSPTGYSAVCNY